MSAGNTTVHRDGDWNFIELRDDWTPTECTWNFFSGEHKEREIHWKFAGLAQIFARRSEEEHAFSQRVCAKLGKILTNPTILRSTLRFGASSRATVCGLRFGPSRDHAHFHASCVEQWLLPIKALIQSVQRQVQAPVDSNNAYNMQVTQGW